MCEAEEKHMTMSSSHFGGGRGYFTGDLSTGHLVLSCVYPNKSAFKDFGVCMYISGGVFACHKFAKSGKMCSNFNLCQSFFTI